MDSNEFYEFEDRAYVNPTLSSGEQEAFINSLRDIQGQNNAQIAEQTYNLGTAVPSNLGGLGGGEAYFTSRYQTPQVGEMVSNIKAAAQAQALNDVLSNYQSQLQNQYKQAYRNYQKRQGNNTGSGTGGGGGGNTPGGNTSGWDGEIIDEVAGTSNTSGGNIIDRSKQWILDNYQRAIENGTLVEPPKESDYQMTGSDVNQRISERTGIPEWLTNVLKIFG